ncbi:MAG: class I poly(R)-hydroxyalkanoic acid synthase [Sphingomonas sp. SCN 67-18]|uniref:PHA/PHB synthase family protein n=1 Tax=uncultured Sphingomonas sp. TaxID=158754 RepID=UPI00086EBD47|nr:class I poly(R)-hydroxyalkanoic acid synthase [Sphingomonas sp. SCN 67-18]ODU20064.1 MAG: class I poly(R)-hydroxyalkanoic acid synthase [Sphingomonas sp. SCN 67-18]
MSDAAMPTMPSLEDMQRWTWVIGRIQQMLLEHGLEAMKAAADAPGAPAFPGFGDPSGIARAQNDFWADSMALWQKFMTAGAAAGGAAEPAVKDRRFAAPQWAENPLFDMIRQSYMLIADHMLRGVDAIEGVDAAQREKIRFATRGYIDAMSPSNFALTNPQVIEKTLETRGENLVRGLEHMLRDIGKGQLTHTDPDAFEVGRNIAVTPGKVVKETPLYQLIHYAPTTTELFAVPLIIFPPWINRFYILDLNPEKSFIRWAVAQGLSVFVVSWKSADASMKEVSWDDYIVNGQIDAIDTVRALLDVPAVHAIGYCVAGTTLAATLALLAARGEADKVASATFFTAQVDFTRAGELNLFVDDEQLKLVESLSADGYLDGRYMAATFNLLRGRDLIWSYVVNNYLMGQDYAPFDLLHWNGDTTNLPAKWHKAYLTDLYRDNRLVQPGAVQVAGTPIDLRKVATPSYVQAGREDHIAPAESVWKIMDHFAGPVRFVLAGSGHIAGVVNPPSAGKYQYWTNEAAVGSLADFIAGASETKGSWWPDWIAWIAARDGDKVSAKGARVPGKGRLKAIEDAPGRYVKTR